MAFTFRRLRFSAWVLGCLGACSATTLPAAETGGAPEAEWGRLGTEWLGPSGLDAALEEGRAPFASQWDNSGAHVELLLPEDGNDTPPVIRLIETNEGTPANNGSRFLLHFPRNTPLVERINDILARPAGTPPVDFELSFDLRETERSSHLAFTRIQFQIHNRDQLAANTDIRRLSRYDDALTGYLRLNAERLPALRFRVYPGDARPADAVRVVMDIRIDGHGTPEVWDIANLALHEIEPPDATAPWPVDARKDGSGDVGFIGFTPSPVMIGALARAGLAIARDPLPDNGPPPQLLVIGNAGDRLKDPALAKRLVNHVRDGGALWLSVVGLGDRIDPALDLALPVNAWSYRDTRNERPGVPLVGGGDPLPEDDLSDFATALFREGAPRLDVRTYMDLHLPGAPVENSLARYRPEQLRKPVWNHDWRPLLRAALVDGMPVLVEGRAGAGRAFVFGVDFEDDVLLASPGFPAFLDAFLPYATRKTPSSGSGPFETDEGAVTVRVASSVPSGAAFADAPLATIRHPGGRTLPVTLSVKVTGPMREFYGARTLKVDLPADGVLTLTAGQLLGSGDGPRFLAERELPYRRLTLGVLHREGRSVLAEADALVLLRDPVTLTATARTGPERDTDLIQLPLPFDNDGRLHRRYIYPSGDAAVYDLEIANGLLNLAPLAVARDADDPKNNSAVGLNDLSYSTTSARGNAPQSGWSGRRADRQELILEWPEAVTVAGQRLEGYGPYRNWRQANPPRIEVAGRSGAQSTWAPLLAERDTAYVLRGDGELADRKLPYKAGERAHQEDAFDAPAVVSCLRLVLSGFEPDRTISEPRHLMRKQAETDESEPINCSIQEWEVYGWPSPQPPPAAHGRLQVVATEVFSGRETVLVDRPLELAAFERVRESVTVPSGPGLELWRVAATWTPTPVVSGAGGFDTPTASTRFDTLFVPPFAPRLVAKNAPTTAGVGLLCSRGWCDNDSFGRGLGSRIAGWGGYDPEIWCWTNHLSEMGLGQGPGADSLFVNRGVPSHYTNPWKSFPNGEYAWREFADILLGLFQPGGRLHNRGYNALFASGEDRWNGVPVGQTVNWGEFIAFDHHLRDQGGDGLTGRTWKEIADDIIENHGLDWQRWHLNRYADALLDTQALFAENGLGFSFGTHGSFPFAGGELGAKLAKTHRGVGTDLFWELRKQDLRWSLGTRFAVVAANPDLESGAYKEWGWVNSEANQWWYANGAQVEPARRQWYATYWMGRINQQGEFAPYHMMGFDSQGAYSTFMSAVDLRHLAQTVMTMVNLRPREAVGYGLVVSWDRYESKIPHRLGRTGFGLYGAPASEDIEGMFSHVFDKATKAGLPVSFVANTTSLENWSGTQPLLLAGGLNYSLDELATLERLNANGAPLVAFGTPADDALPEVLDFFGVRRGKNGALETAPDAASVLLTSAVSGAEREVGRIVVQTPAGGVGARVWVPGEVERLSHEAARAVADWLTDSGAGPRLRLPAGLSGTVFAAEGRLFLALTDHTDTSGVKTISLAPADFLPALRGAPLRVVEMDEARVLPAVVGDDGVLTLALDIAASDGRLLAIGRMP